jgi:hypothetical protein
MGSDDRIVTSGDESSHVESRANARPASPCYALSSAPAAVTIQWSNADQGGDLLPRASAQLGQVGQQGQGRLRSHAGHTPQQVFLFSPGRGLFEGLLQLVIQLLDLLGERCPNRINGLANQPVGHLLGAISFCGKHPDELASPGELLLQFQLFSAGQRTLLGPYRPAKLGQDLRVDGVCFGKLPRGASEISDLARVDDHDRQLRRGQLGNDSSFVATGGLQNDRLERPFGKLLDELPVSVGRIGPLADAIGRCDIELVFGNINSNYDRIHEVVPSLLMRACQAAAQATVRAKSHDAGRDQATARSQDPGSVDHAAGQAAPLRSLRSLRGAA